MKIKSSPYFILVFIRRFALLFLTLPFQPLLMVRSEPYTKVFIIATDLFVFITILLCAFISLKSISLSATTSRFILKYGVLLRKELTFEHTRLQTVSISQSFLQKLLKVYKVTFVSSNAKGEIYLSTKVLKKLPCPIMEKAVQNSCIFRSKPADLLIMSAGLSPALGAALSFAPFIRSVSKLSAKDISSANLWSALGYEHLPPLLATTSSLLFILWFSGTLLSFLRHFNLCLIKKDQLLQINRGLISTHHIVFSPKDIRSVVFRQSLVMLLFHIQTAEFLLANVEKTPRVTAGCVRRSSHQKNTADPVMFKISEVYFTKISPHKGALISYTLLPLLSLSALSIFSILISKLSPYRIEPHLGVFICLWCCVWFLHRCYAFYHSSLSLSERTLQMCTCYGLSFLKAFIPLENIRCTKITQNLFQSLKGTCNLRIFVKNKKKTSYLIRHIEIKKAAELSRKLCGK